MAKTILCDLSDARKIVEEEKLYWAFKVLENLGVTDEVYDVDNIDDFRYNMDELGIEVEYVTDGTVNIYKKHWFDGGNDSMSGWLPAKKEHLVAQWKEPTYVKRVDRVNRSAYYEIYLNEWSIGNMRKPR